MLALMFILLMGRSVVNLLILAVSLVVMSLIVKMSIRKDRIHTGATAISVLLLLLFPVSFFSAGGFFSGMPEWFVLCFIYIPESVNHLGEKFPESLKILCFW